MYGPVALSALALLYNHHQHLPPGLFIFCTDTQYLLNSSFSASPPLAPGNHHSPFRLQVTQLSGLIILGSIKILPLALDLLAEGSYLNGDTTDGDRQKGVCPVGQTLSEDTQHINYVPARP